MTVTEFLQHWQLTENPFRGEEARSDPVFARMLGGDGLREAALANGAAIGAAPATNGSASAASGPAQPASPDSPAAAMLAHAELGAFHAEFDRILGDLRRPASSVVFGEKGSGKTAIRIQLARRVREHNVANPGAKVLLVGYDDLNAVLDRLHERVDGKTPLDSLQKMRVVDHMDAMLHAVVPRVVNAVLGLGGDDLVSVPADFRKTVKNLDRGTRRDLLLLQALYDTPDPAPQRTVQLRKRLKLFPPVAAAWSWIIVYVLPLLLAAALVWAHFFADLGEQREFVGWALAVVMGFYAVIALKVGVWDRLRLLRTAHRVRRQIRVVSRGDVSYARSLRQLPPVVRETAQLPVTDSDDQRYACFDKLRCVLRIFGYTGLIVVVDRVDEPTLVSGDPDRMKAVIWPMLNNKFLQQEGVGFKLLLPMELRHAVFRESSAFFQEARLDKQHMVDHLSWTGSTLYDLCNARLTVCRTPEAGPVSLIELFAPDVTRQDVLEALERVHQPRDAFKLVYRCIIEHCAQVPRGQEDWRIARHVLQSVTKAETERVQQMYRGIRPG